MSEKLQKIIQTAESMTPDLRDPVEEIIGLLGRGKLRVCTKTKDGWLTHSWLKKAILFYFKAQSVRQISAGDINWYDKIPLKKWTPEMEVRAVPTSVVRHGAFVSNGAILMPSFVNIGAYVDSGTMVDTWATVGSCAQIGKNVHLSGGVGIGGVLEPLQAQPVIIEDNAFLGSRCVVVEGVRVEEGAVLGAGVILTQSTKIIDVTATEPVEHRGVVPANSVVIPGSQDKHFPSGKYQVPCALIIGKRSASTDLKTSLNQTLREFEVSV
jgi:2,3,4,5-tetrahydropyridine-2-carboxylate N-succinyltransferase